MELKPGRKEARVVVVDGREAVKIRLTQGRVALIDVEDWEKVRVYRWHALKIDRTFYAARSFLTKKRV